MITGFVNFGSHGVGKSKAMKKYAKKHGLKIKKLKLKKSELVREDFLGLPVGF